ncbi:MAG: GAF domain-containing protein [Fimbriimonadaceae bacterium]
MVDLGARLILAGLTLLVAGLAGVPEFDVAWKVAVVVVAYAGFAYYISERPVAAGGFAPATESSLAPGRTTRRRPNSGLAGFFAIADAFAIAMLLGSGDALATAGFLVLAPCAYAAARYGSSAASMAPLASAGLLAAHAAFNRGEPMSPALLCQAGGVLVVGLLMGRRHDPSKEQSSEGVGWLVPAAPDDLQSPTPPPTETEAYLQLREHYRQVRGMFRDLEQRSRREHLLAELTEAKLGEGEPFFKRLALKVQELVGADSVAIYTLAQFDEMMVVRGVAGKYPETMQSVSHRVDLEKAPGQIKHAVEKAVEALRTEDNRAHFANVILSDRGRMAGMACVFHEHSGDLDQVRSEMEELAPMVAALIREEDKREARERRLRETELLYDLAATAAGAENAASVASRVVHELGKVVDADHFGIFLIDGAEALAVAQGGIPIRLIEKMAFPKGEGLQGWLDSGAPEVVIGDAMNDPRLPKAEAIKRRIQSYCIFPVQYREAPTGFLAAGSQRAGGLDLPDVASLRTIAAELGQALARLNERADVLGGLVTPREFQRVLATQKQGYLVYLEPLRKEQLIDAFGRPAVAHALHKCGRRIRSKLPLGGAICRRSEGDFMAYLPVATEQAAETWANAVSALSMLGITTPDGSAKIPLALRARVAPLGEAIETDAGTNRPAATAS